MPFLPGLKMQMEILSAMPIPRRSTKTLAETLLLMGTLLDSTILIVYVHIGDEPGAERQHHREDADESAAHHEHRKRSSESGLPAANKPNKSAKPARAKGVAGRIEPTDGEASAMRALVDRLDKQAKQFLFEPPPK